MQIKDLFDDLPLSTGVADIQLQKLLREPLDICNDWQRTENLLLEAHQRMPDKLEVLVALYKMYAYSNRFDESLQRINQVLVMSALQAGFAVDWRVQEPGPDWLNLSGARRLYVYSMKATGFVQLRKGNVEQAMAVLLKLQALDPGDQVGGSVVLEMAQRLVEADAD
ncbi:hypothetical protein [Ketobacter sp.]|uniref:hypothetical protein n=1 Tax=Ketobacter sp. TaxID=2083498 RepID=UPI000F1C2F86|nr:hypothetical protein [Ketobacter sp.]RLT96348.1 MAG: hypothetical protein D9N14_13725 [Ketobacter sp.]